MKVLSNITDVIEVDVLQEIQDMFSKATGLAAVTVDCCGNPVTAFSNFTPYCKKVRADRECLECCHRSDAHGGIESARSGKPSIYICHGGLVDVAVPIMVKGNYLGAILAGQVRIPEEEMTSLPRGAISESIDLSARSDRDELAALKKNVKMLSREQVKSAADMLYVIADFLVERQMFNIMQDELHKKDLALVEEMKQRGKIETALKETELKVLQSQINPHFLFNVLNTIGRLALLENAERTQEMVYTFSDMMRYALKSSTSDFVTLGEEMNHVRNYLSLQKVRLGQRLNEEYDIDPGCEKVMCPFMTIQPFVENAVNYAVEPNINGGKIEISAKIDDGQVLIRIADDGPGIPQTVIDALQNGNAVRGEDMQGNGKGIENTIRRLKLYLGDQGGITLNAMPETGTEVLIRLPMIIN